MIKVNETDLRVLEIETNKTQWSAFSFGQEWKDVLPEGSHSPQSSRKRNYSTDFDNIISQST